VKKYVLNAERTFIKTRKVNAIAKLVRMEKRPLNGDLQNATQNVLRDIIIARMIRKPALHVLKEGTPVKLD